MSVQQSALEQLSQAYAKGKPDMTEWRALQQAMPGQLKQIATAMNKTTDQLGEDLRSGEVSMNAFMKTVVELNKKGIEGFQSFEEQAKNSTGGLRTSIANMKSAITRGVSDIITNINEGLEEANLPTISELISGTGKTIEKVLKQIGNGIKTLIKVLTPVYNLFKTIGGFIVNNWSFIAPIILGIAGALAIVKGAQIAYNIAVGIGKALNMLDIVMLTIRVGLLEMQTGATFKATMAQYGFNTALFACPLTWILLAIVAVIGVIYLAVAAINKVTGSSISATGIIMGAIYTLGAYIYNNFVVPVWNAIAMLVNFFANCFKNPVASIKVLFAELTVWVLNKTKSMIEGIEKMINLIPGVKIDITSGLGNYISMLERGIQGIKEEAGLEDVMSKLSTVSLDGAYNKGYEFGSNLGKGATNKIEETTQTLSDVMDSINDTIGSDSTGGKALKTTTNDDLFSEDDIQLLLDVATRDYKLNYQQVTPNITLTFGDIRETADVDDIVDELADKLQEIYDGNLEVE